MTFNNLLEIHEEHLTWIKRQLAVADTETKKSYWLGAFSMEGTWFSKLKLECADYVPKQWIKSATEIDKINFSFDSLEPEKLLIYRDHILPIYIDDYGQCYFTKFNDNVISGGFYNVVPEYDFCDFADKFIDKELLK